MLIGMNPRIKKHEIAKGIFMLFISNFHQQNINLIVDIYVENVFLTLQNTMIYYLPYVKFCKNTRYFFSDPILEKIKNWFSF